MKKAFALAWLVVALGIASGEDRFGRPTIKVREPKQYEFAKLDDVKYPTLSDERYSVSCLVYRGTERYYVEARVMNKTKEPVSLEPTFISFDKPGYTLIRTDTLSAAREAASVAGLRFVATPAPYVAPTYNTTLNATAVTYGNQTSISGTATTTPDYSGQAGANLGNAIGNAIAAHRFYKAQQTETAFAQFLWTHAQSNADSALQPGESRSIVATFEQAKPKKRPFTIALQVGGEAFHFDYKE